MEHILQFAISIDDETIKSRIEASAEKQIVETLKEEVICSIFECDWRGKPDRTRVDEWVKERVDEFLVKEKDAIIEGAVGRISEKLGRSKGLKDAIGKVACE